MKTCHVSKTSNFSYVGRERSYVGNGFSHVGREFLHGRRDMSRLYIGIYVVRLPSSLQPKGAQRQAHYDSSSWTFGFFTR